MNCFSLFFHLVCLVTFYQAVVDADVKIQHRYNAAGKLVINIINTRFKERFEATLTERGYPLRDVDVIRDDDKTLQIWETQRGRVFEGHIDGCAQCRVTVVYFADVNVIYGIFDFIHYKLYVEPNNVANGNDLVVHRVSQLPRNVPKWTKRSYINKTLIPLSFYVDIEFYRMFDSDHLAVYRYLIANVEFVTHIYQPLEFGLNQNNEVITGLNFAVVKITIEDGKSKYDYGDKVLVNIDRLHESFEKVVDSSDVCAAVIITGRTGITFYNGLSEVGDKYKGICLKTRLYGKYFNTIALTMLTVDRFEPAFDLHRTLAHEIGHSFGANHDELYMVNTTDTIMTVIRSSGDSELHFTFLKKAKESMAVRLLNILEELEFSGSTSKCGNGILELGEQCDPGAEGIDDCCAEVCELKVNAKCSPIHEVCCLNNCNFAPYTTKCPIQPDDICLVSYCTGTSAACNQTTTACEQGVHLADDVKYKTAILILLFIVIGIFLTVIVINRTYLREKLSSLPSSLYNFLQNLRPQYNAVG